jgi:hypothetical protein
MPTELYEQVVLPCWKSNELDDAASSSLVGDEHAAPPSSISEHSFALRPTFAELTARLGRLCAELNKRSRKKRTSVLSHHLQAGGGEGGGGRGRVNAGQQDAEEQEEEQEEQAMQPSAPYATIRIPPANTFNNESEDTSTPYATTGIPFDSVGDSRESDGAVAACGEQEGGPDYRGAHPPLLVSPECASMSVGRAVASSQQAVRSPNCETSINTETETRNTDNDLTTHLHEQRYGGRGATATVLGRQPSTAEGETTEGQIDTLERQEPYALLTLPLEQCDPRGALRPVAGGVGAPLDDHTVRPYLTLSLIKGPDAPVGSEPYSVLPLAQGHIVTTEPYALLAVGKGSQSTRKVKQSSVV